MVKTPEDLVAYQAAVQGVFTKVTLAFIVVGTLAFWFTAWACREQVVRTQPRVTIKETIGTLKSNKPLAYLCGSSFFYLIGLFAVGGTTAFYAQYVLGNIGLVGLITLVNTGITLLVTPFIPKIIDMFGKRTSSNSVGCSPSSAVWACSSLRRTCSGSSCSHWPSRASARA
jgi:glucuronide carrier protein